MIAALNKTKEKTPASGQTCTDCYYMKSYMMILFVQDDPLELGHCFWKDKLMLMNQIPFTSIVL